MAMRDSGLVRYFESFVDITAKQMDPGQKVKLSKDGEEHVGILTKVNSKMGEATVNESGKMWTVSLGNLAIS